MRASDRAQVPTLVRTGDMPLRPIDRWLADHIGGSDEIFVQLHVVNDYPQDYTLPKHE